MSSRIEYIKVKTLCHVCTAVRAVVQKNEKDRELPEDSGCSLAFSYGSKWRIPFLSVTSTFHLAFSRNLYYPFFNTYGQENRVNLTFFRYA